ncbi:hypothetical protein ACFV0G_25970, partial [Kitasatospora sp. NPDC059571]
MDLAVHPAERRRGTGRALLAAAAVAARGDLLHTVAVLAEPDGAMVGFTEPVVPGDGGGDGLHYGTGVLPAHRGPACWMKAESIRTGAGRRAAAAGGVADTADGPRGRGGVHGSLGYRAGPRLWHN